MRWGQVEAEQTREGKMMKRWPDGDSPLQTRRLSLGTWERVFLANVAMLGTVCRARPIFRLQILIGSQVLPLPAHLFRGSPTLCDCDWGGMLFSGV
ncbi:hypothetical protein DUNSADRAFT_12769 [Dunaliella salina]|uniref:Uncharacterized protein n=1 Tax=Dunaliella salina TaxID=3046 RepID=A0ABQ7GAK9_DUNSA|nr:hypothetical protein DUNSADRAFT_12769 [Dunaliella salina]|eukprot:KAF5831641.1 hypothetical protein DUNSADRAFT_12769 [Dunaliella salina]